MGYVIVVFIRIVTAEEIKKGNVVALFGYIIILLVLGYDFIGGDLIQFLGRRNGSRYETVRDLGNQVYICKWHGLPHKNPHYILPDSIIDVPEREQRSSNSRYVILAVVQGILCELLPFSEETKLALEHVITQSFVSEADKKASDKDWWMPFVGLDVFDSLKSDIRRLTVWEKSTAVSKLKKEDREDMEDFMAARSRMSKVSQEGWAAGG